MGIDVVQGLNSDGWENNYQSVTVQKDEATNQVTGDHSSDSNEKEDRTYPPFTKNQLDDLVSQANQILTPETTEIHYVLHQESNKYYVQVEDSVTHQVIREIPPKKFMDMYAAIAEKLGLIVNKRA
ncbi:MAG: flagellar protein FlaG [Sporolactobacillus sp.]